MKRYMGDLEQMLAKRCSLELSGNPEDFHTDRGRYAAFLEELRGKSIALIAVHRNFAPKEKADLLFSLLVSELPRVAESEQTTQWSLMGKI